MTHNMGERYSLLRPLNPTELHRLTFYMWNFFSPLNAHKMQKLLDIPQPTKKIQPFSLMDFMTYLKHLDSKADPYRFKNQIICLAKKLTDQGILIHAGQKNATPGLGQCYYTMKELTSLQNGSSFWLGSILGEQYLRELLEDFIVRIEGTNGHGLPRTGSGVLISPDTILTCAHNIQDMNISSCWVKEKELTIIGQSTHGKHDIGIVKIAPINVNRKFPYLGSPFVLDKTLTLGYPPMRGIREPLLLAQSGEINAIGSEVFTDCECITISSITRPGNSGGPVFSMQGYIVGIVIEQASSVSSFGADNEESDRAIDAPFYLAISSNTLRHIIPEIDTSVSVSFEDYQ